MAYFSVVKKMFESKDESSSATCSAIPYAIMVEQFLERTKACEDRVQGMLTANVDGSMLHLRVNSKQCRYLAEKLKLAVQEAEMFLRHLQGSSSSQEEETNRLNEFQLLHNLACAVENFIQNCCKDAWVVTAFLILNTSQDVLSISFDLALLAAFFSRNCMIKIDIIYGVEASNVTKIAACDRHLLLRNVKELLRTDGKSSSEYRLADHLVRTLETLGAYSTDIGSLTEEKSLARGGSATVYKSTWLGVDVAVKTFHGPSSPDFKKEVEILGPLSHPNVTSLFCYAEDDRECSIVMGLMDCDLSELIRIIMRDRSRKPCYPFSMIEAVDIMLQVGKGVEYLHAMKIVHRDLKAANILVKQLGTWGDGESKIILAKVADFGLSRTKEKSMTYSMQTFNTGTTRWMAPEVIQMRCIEGEEEVSSDTKVMKYPYRSDVYSFGMVCFEILTGNIPFFEIGRLSEVKAKILSGDRPELPEHCFAELKDVITRCWSQDASKRPRFDEICTKLRSFRSQLLFPGMEQRIAPQVAIELHNGLGGPRCWKDSRGAMAEAADEAKIVVGLDLGTTYSGYAFAHKWNPEQILTCYDWPLRMEPYCKTLSAIYYQPGDALTAKVKSWGFPALHDYTKDMNNLQKLRERSATDLTEIGTYLVPFKLHLANKDVWESSAARLPKGFTVTQVISDYLREIGASIMRHLWIMYGNGITIADVQWCVTVPSIWDDHAKKQMQECMVRSGLVRSMNAPAGSPHPLSIVLAPEAASCYCHRIMPDFELKVGDRLLVADLGGVTTDVVVQEWISETPYDYRVKEVTYSTGGLCGGTYVDEQFNKFLFGKIQCLPQLIRKSTAIIWEIGRQWEEIKCSFGDLVTIRESFEIQLPRMLAAVWEEFDEEHGNPPRQSYDELELTHSDIKAIFDPVVEQNLALIDDQVKRTQNVKVILVVGGFAGSPYLLTKIRERFRGIVEKVISPVQPGSAIFLGAVMLARKLDRITGWRF